MIWLGIIILLIVAALGAPLFSVLLGASLLGFYGLYDGELDVVLSIIPIELYRIVDTPLLVALPLFTFSGYLLSEANTSTRLVNLMQSLFGWLPSGLAIVAFIACAVFTALTGASGVTIVALGALLLPALKQAGFADKFSLGLVTTSGSLGLLLVPSVPLILYGVIAQQLNVGEPFTVVELFVAGVAPLCLMLSLLIGWTLWHHRGGKIPRISFTLEKLSSALWDARWELPLPFVVLGGVFGGYFAISEAAAVTAAYVVLAEVVLYREVAWRQLSRVAVESMVMVGGILLILGIALGFTNFLVDAEAPQQLLAFMNRYIEDPLSFLILLNVLLLILGAMLDIFSALVIMVPLLLPVAVGYGVHPVHLGIIFLANMQIGYFTPPVGMNLFIASYRFKKPLTELYSATLPFLLVLLLALMLITYFPLLSLWHLDT
ncbi:MAG: C4-dicarboxylate ABC transporter [Gammaproteobacteria bacterium]|jgi:tripartite ATP-independent transporter DctM subunit|nr:C4-dicarboxylate ABC transporter [Gammaproteobacteria bacterium]MAQ61771.1 C4-dicarboxylate ABC transporter [Gammaproteobacteria bacterium]HBW99520.1 C4-dicarboxylate ABC transporter [Gammaproteobacteria bacterium]|tara:strand:- start:2530 stop:3828 length:1299 start_codon:yes stop_codon:yes gene_type:complete